MVICVFAMAQKTTNNNSKMDLINVQLQQNLSVKEIAKVRLQKTQVYQIIKHIPKIN